MHHAYLYYGSAALLEALVADARTQFGFEGKHSPDVHTFIYEKFGIEEARDLNAMGALKSSSGRALYIMSVSQITSEAQQALLKLFEEPQEGTIFILLAPHGTIIPTLRSRFLEYPQQWQQNVLPNGLASPAALRLDEETRGPFGERFAKMFLAASSKARSDSIIKLLKDDEGVRERVRDFLDSLEASLRMALTKTKGKKEIREALEDIARVRSYANDRSPSLKMLLEHLALSIPTLK